MAWIHDVHDFILLICQEVGFTTNDIVLHFLIFGFFGFILFQSVQFLFNRTKKSKEEKSWIRIFTISFILFLAVTLSVEILQVVSGRGQGEVKDMLSNISGFVAFNMPSFIKKFLAKDKPTISIKTER